jgi:trimeric autotransporter adhesin
MADPVVTSQDKPADDFEAAFAQISEADAAGKTVAPSDIKAAPVVEKTAEQVEAERVAAEAAAATTTATTETVVEKTAEQIEAERVAAETAAKADDQNLVARLATLIKGADPQATAREVAAAAQAEAQRITDEKAAADAVRAQQAPQLSKDEMALVQQVEKDFPDVARAQAIVRRAEYQQVVRYIFDEVTRANAAKDAQLAPFLTLVQNLAERTHVGDLKSAVPDYDKVDVKALTAWIETQPAYLRGGYDSVLRTGTAAEVKDVVDRFRASTGATQVADPKVAAAAAAAEAARKKVITSLAPVQSGRTAAPAGEAPKDFDNAFDEFAKILVANEAADRFSR